MSSNAKMAAIKAQNRLLLLCEAIPDCGDDLNPSPISDKYLEPIPTSAGNASIATNRNSVSSARTDLSSVSLSSTSSDHLRIVTSPSSPVPSSSESSTTQDRHGGRSSASVVPTLLLSPTDDLGDTLGSGRAAGKRKNGAIDKAIPIKLSKKLGAGFIIFSITNHFNAGDTEKLGETILMHSTEDCLFHVKTISRPLSGNIHIVSFLCSLLDALPDTYIITANETVLDEYTLKVSIKFRGTRLHKTDTFAVFMKENLVDNMNLAKYSVNDIDALRAQEQLLLNALVPIELVFQGTVTVSFTEKIFDSRRKTMIDFSRVAGKVNSFILDYELKSFRDASIADPSASV